MAVYTHITEKQLSDFLTQFDLGGLVSFEGITEGIDNTNYIVTTEKGRHVLTIFEKRINPSELPFYTGLMDHLRKKGIPCPQIAQNRDGKRILPLAEKPAMITGFLPGAWPRVISAAQAQSAGALLAGIHTASKDFQPKRANNLSLSAWRGLIHACRGKTESLEAGLFEFLDAEMDDLEKNWPKMLRRRAVHADFFPDNVFFDGDKVTGVIDFYFACTETIVYDLMLAFNPWCFDHDGTLDNSRARAFMTGYLSQKKLSPAEIKALPFFGRAAALRIISTRLYDWLHPAVGALVKPKDPMEHVRILRFHKNAAPADYGVTA